MKKLVIEKVYKKIFMGLLGLFSAMALFAANATAFSPDNEEEIKNKLSKILDSIESSEQIEARSLLEVLHDKFFELIKKIWNKLNMTDKLQKVLTGSKVSKEFMVVLQIIAIILIVAIIVLLIYLVKKRLKFSRKIRREEDALLLNILKDADEVYKKAFDYYSNGDYTQALRYLYISLLIQLNDLNIIRINKAKTNKQYLIEIKDNKPEIYDVVAEFTHVFNKYWYGGKHADKAIFVNWNDIYGNLMGSFK